MKNKTKILTYKGIDIYYHFEDGYLRAEDKKTNEKFKEKYLFEIKEQINKPFWTECNEKGFIIDGIFNDEIYLVIAKRKNKKDNKPHWIRKKGTGYGYNNGREIDYSDRNKNVYPYTEYNKKVFESVKEKTDRMRLLEQNIIKEIKKLKK